MAQIIKLDGKRRLCENCRFLRIVKRPSAFGSGEFAHRLCGARQFPKKPDPQGMMRPARKTTTGADDFIYDEDLAFARCFGLNDFGTCALFKPKFREVLCGKKAAAR